MPSVLNEVREQDEEIPNLAFSFHILYTRINMISVRFPLRANTALCVFSASKRYRIHMVQLKTAAIIRGKDRDFYDISLFYADHLLPARRP